MWADLQIVGSYRAGSYPIQLRLPEVLQGLARGLRGKRGHPSPEEIGSEHKECAQGGQLVKTLTQEFLLGLGGAALVFLESYCEHRDGARLPEGVTGRL